MPGTGITGACCFVRARCGDGRSGHDTLVAVGPAFLSCPARPMCCQLRLLAAMQSLATFGFAKSSTIHRVEHHRCLLHEFKCPWTRCGDGRSGHDRMCRPRYNSCRHPALFRHSHQAKRFSVFFRATCIPGTADDHLKTGFFLMRKP